MNDKDRAAWMKKTEKLNADRELFVGDVVSDPYGGRGVVVKIALPENPEANDVGDHGTVYVWQENKTRFGDDNCEHFTWSNWKQWLRVEVAPYLVNNGIMLADLIDANEVDEWAGSAISGAMANALRRMDITDTQLKLFLEELQKPQMNLNFIVPGQIKNSGSKPG